MYEYSALIVSVYDGDTIKANIDLGLGVSVLNETLRLYGINTPELRNPTMVEGLLARDALRSRVLNKYVRVQTIKNKSPPIREITEKYGRYLAVVSDDLGNVNDWLIESGHAVRYLS